MQKTVNRTYISKNMSEVVFAWLIAHVVLRPLYPVQEEKIECFPDTTHFKYARCLKQRKQMQELSRNMSSGKMPIRGHLFILYLALG